MITHKNVKIPHITPATIGSTVTDRVGLEPTRGILKYPPGDNARAETTIVQFSTRADTAALYAWYRTATVFAIQLVNSHPVSINCNCTVGQGTVLVPHLALTVLEKWPNPRNKKSP